VCHVFFFFSSRRRHTRFSRDWSSDVCSSDLRPSQPASHTRTSYQVGRPWMLDGKMLRGLTGTPMRRIALANSSLADAEPEPLTRSEERRVGKEGRSGWGQKHRQKKY